MSGGVLSRKVAISTPDGPIDVVFSTPNVNQYNEVLSLAGLATSTIITYTVPVGKIFSLQSIDYNGENKAIYSVDLNASVISKQHAYYTDLKGRFLFNNLEFVAGDIIKLIVENKTNKPANFNANLLGRVDNA